MAKMYHDQLLDEKINYPDDEDLAGWRRLAIDTLLKLRDERNEKDKYKSRVEYLSEELTEAIKTAINMYILSGYKIMAIKLVRATKDMDLKEAKEYVENLQFEIATNLLGNMGTIKDSNNGFTFHHR